MKVICHKCRRLIRYEEPFNIATIEEEQCDDPHCSDSPPQVYHFPKPRSFVPYPEGEVSDHMPGNLRLRSPQTT